MRHRALLGLVLAACARQEAAGPAPETMDVKKVAPAPTRDEPGPVVMIVFLAKPLPACTGLILLFGKLFEVRGEPGSKGEDWVDLQLDGKVAFCRPR